MKRFFLFAGDKDAPGLEAFVGDYDQQAEAFLAVLDLEFRATWWNILDTKTGEVVDRSHLRSKDNMMAFAKSERILGSGAEHTEDRAEAPKPGFQATPSPIRVPSKDAPKDVRTGIVEGLEKSLNLSGLVPNGKENAA